MAEEHQGAIPVSDDDMHDGDRDALAKRKNPFEDTRIVERPSDEPPSWMQNFTLSLKEEVQNISGSVAALAILLQREGDERRADIQRESHERKTEVSELHKRIDDLSGQLEVVVKNTSKGEGRSHNMVPPPLEPVQTNAAVRAPMQAGSSSNQDPWAQYMARGSVQQPLQRPLPRPFPSPNVNKVPSDPGSVPTSPEREMPNFNRLVMGGWDRDMPRREIQAAVAASIAGWDLAERHAVVKTVVYGQRARTAHVFLKDLDPDDARARFYKLQEAHGSKIQTGTDSSWYSPSKSADVRRKNRSTRKAKEILDPQIRSRLTRHIIALRHIEKTAWMQQLHQRSREGGSTAIRYLKQRFQQQKGDVNGFSKERQNHPVSFSKRARSNRRWTD